MFYIIGRIADQKVLETSGIISAVDMNSYKTAVATNYGGATGDYSILTIDEKSADGARIRSGDKWEAVWTGATLTGVSFAAYDAKNFMIFKADKIEIVADGSDKCTITVLLTDADDKEITPDISGIYIPVQSSDLCKKKVDFIKGQAQFDFSTSRAGAWRFPSNGTLTIGDYRVKNQIIIEALLA